MCATRAATTSRATSCGAGASERQLAEQTTLARALPLRGGGGGSCASRWTRFPMCPATAAVLVTRIHDLGVDGRVDAHQQGADVLVAVVLGVHRLTPRTRQSVLVG